MNHYELTIPTFTEKAACSTEDPEIFFPPEGNGNAAALKVCNGCNVREQCLKYALEYEATHPGSRWGIFGGTSPRQRRTLSDKIRKGVAA